MYLRLLCALADIDQETLAARSGIHKATLWRYGTGDLRPREGTLQRLAEAVGLPWRMAREAVLPSLREWRLETAKGLQGMPEVPPSTVLELADRLGEQIRARLTAEAGGPPWMAWKPMPELPHPRDREDADFLASCLNGASREDIDFLLGESPELHSWVLVEHLCHREDSSARLEAATLAARIAPLAPGPKGWKLRLRGYAEAFHGQALAEAGVTAAARAALAEARRLWAKGADPKGLLSEERFRRAVGAASAFA